MFSKKIKSGYESEFTRFINGYLAQHPDVVDDQRRGWYIWWDHKIDPNDIKRELSDKLPYAPYQ